MMIVGGCNGSSSRVKIRARSSALLLEAIFVPYTTGSG